MVYTLLASGSRRSAFLDLDDAAPFPAVAITCRMLREPAGALPRFGATVAANGHGEACLALSATTDPTWPSEAWPLDPAANSMRDRFGDPVLAVEEDRLLVVDAEPTASVTLTKVLGVARELGLSPELACQRPADARELILVNEPFALLPVVAIDGALVGDGRPGTVFTALSRALGRAVGIDLAQQVVGLQGV